MMVKDHVQALEKRSNVQKGMYIKQVLEKLAVPYKTQPFRTLLARGENTIVDYPFSSQKSSGRKILLTAHYNAFFRTPGANDNASGVAVLLAFIEKLEKERPRGAPLRIVFFDLEDGWAIVAGSKHYVKAVGTNHIDRLYNLEMVGMGEYLALWPTTKKDASEPWLRSLLESAKKENVPTIHVPSFGPTFTSDHAPFLKSGFTKVCSLVMIPKEDLRFQKLIVEKRWLQFLWMINRYLFTKTGDIPLLVKIHHSKDDTSKFIKEETLRKILAILWQSVTGYTI